MAKICPSCGTYNPDKAKFCTSCGDSMLAAPAQAPQQPQVQSYSQIQPSTGGQCLYCKQSAGFKEEEGRLDSKWGFTSHKFRFFICNNCGFSHMFGEGRSIWDFD